MSKFSEQLASWGYDTSGVRKICEEWAAEAKKRLAEKRPEK